MITRIGIVAGEIWHYLEKQGSSQLSEMMPKINKPRDMILMSLGWLVREGHVAVEGEEDYRITLRKKDETKTTT